MIPRVSMVGFDLAAVQSRCDGPVATRIQRCIEELDEIVKAVRLALLTHVGSDGSGLGADFLLRSLAEHAEHFLGFAPEVSITRPIERIPRAVLGHLRAVAAEAVANTVHHAEASWIAIRLEIRADELRFSVQDDGVGPPDVPLEGRGLAAMAQRARHLRGSFVFVARSPRGSTLRWHVPCATAVDSTGL
ncbi:hypothetical protein AD017_30210 (plasmid) [Pseudonocardia sp. EC080619-01]|nr:hypothetical protein AD017_30210 [Pseudonocardia sp. EC080619-01]